MPRATSIQIRLTNLQELKFWSNVNGYGPEITCWLWGGRVDDFGYGHFKVSGHSLKAHRVAWTLRRGNIPTGMTLDHLCRNPRCVNPSHLQAVTNKENILRGESPTAMNAQKTHCPYGHPLSGENIYTYVYKGHTMRQCKACRRERREAAKTSTR